MNETRNKHPPPWLFGIVGIPYGVGGSFVGIVMPFLASRAKIDIDEIGWFVTLLFFPPMVQVLYAPIVDLGPKRKHWLIIVSVVGAACFAGTFLMPLPDHKIGFLLFGFFGQMITGLTGSCTGGLLALTMPDEKRGAASAWVNTGNLAGGAASAWGTIELLRHDVAPALVGLVYGAMIVVPSIAILVVEEEQRERRSIRQVFSDMIHGVWEVLGSKQGITGFALCLSPVGTAALTNFFSGMKDAFGVSEKLIGFVSGPVSSIVMMVGALVGGWLCDAYNRRALYLLAGLLTAACGIVMAVLPHDRNTFLYGVMTYNLITGFCYAAFIATVLETIGNKAGRAASTQYALFVAAGNVAIAYVGFIDTRFGGKVTLPGGGTRPIVGNVIMSDAALNIIGVVILAFAFWKLKSFGKARLRKKQAAAPPPEVPTTRIHDA